MKYVRTKWDNQYKIFNFKECWGLKELEHSARNQQLTKEIKIKYWTQMSKLDYKLKMKKNI